MKKTRVKENPFYAKDTKIIETCSKTNEPTFSLRAQDSAALPTLLYYKKLINRIGANTSFVDDVDRTVKRFEEFSVNNVRKMKVPD